MVIAFIILIFIVEFLVAGVIFSNIVINIEEFAYSKNEIKTILKKPQINIKIYFFKIIKIVNIRVYKNYLKIFGIKVNFDKVIYKIEEDKSFLKKSYMLLKNKKVNLKNIKPNLDEFKMNLEVATEDASLTSGIVVVASSIISVLMKNAINKFKPEKHFYKIIPKYTNINSISINLETDINFNTVKVLVFGYEMLKLMNEKEVKEEKTISQSAGILERLGIALRKLRILNRLTSINQKNNANTKIN